MAHKLNYITSLLFKDIQYYERNTIYDQRWEPILVRRAQGGDKAARDLLIVAHLRFLVSAAKSMSMQSWDDCFQAASIGMSSAISKHDPTRGVKLLSYAVWWMTRYIMDTIYEGKGVCRVPAALQQAYFKLAREGDSMDIIDQEKAELVRSLMEWASLDAPIKEGFEGTASLFDQIPDACDLPDLALIKEELDKQVAEGLSGLPDRHSEVLRGFFGIDLASPMNMREIATSMGITPERVRQLKDIGIRLIKQRLNEMVEAHPTLKGRAVKGYRDTPD